MIRSQVGGVFNRNLPKWTLPQNINVGHSFDSNSASKSPRIAPPKQHYFGEILTKVVMLGQGILFGLQMDLLFSNDCPISIFVK